MRHMHQVEGAIPFALTILLSLWCSPANMPASHAGDHRSEAGQGRYFPARGPRGTAGPIDVNAEGRSENVEFRTALMSSTLHSTFFVLHLRAPPKHWQRCTRPIREF